MVVVVVTSIIITITIMSIVVVVVVDAMVRIDNGGIDWIQRMSKGEPCCLVVRTVWRRYGCHDPHHPSIMMG